MFFIINFIFIILLLSQYNSKIIVLPFRSNIPKNIKQNNDENAQFFTRELYTEVLIGNPPQCLNININSDSYIFYISPTICYDNSPSFYNYSKSNTFHLITPEYVVDTFDESGDGFYASDFLSFYNSTDLNTNITKKGFEFYYSSYLLSNKNNEVCGSAGLGLKQKNANYNYDNFIHALKKKSLIDKYSWTYIFFQKDLNQNNKIFNLPKINNDYIINNFEGIIIIGNYPHEYNPIDYDQKYFVSTLATERDNNLKWDIIFNKIYTTEDQNNIIGKNIQADLSINYNYIISPKEFFDNIILSFFNFFITNQICQIKRIKKSLYDYDIIICIKDKFTIIDIKKFPTLNFYQQEFNYTFQLSYKDLFEQMDNDIYFLILKNNGNSNKNIWKMGKIFLRKYQFIFNQDSKTISFYNNNKANNNFITERNNIIKRNKKNFNINYIWIIICFICLICGIYIGNKIIIRNRKIRANELQDEYDYRIENINNDNKKNYLNEKNIEMGSKNLGI